MERYAARIYRLAYGIVRDEADAEEVVLEDALPRFLDDGHREGAWGFLVADWSRTPEAELLSRETRAVLSRAIETLPDRYRAVLVLRDIEGVSNEEVAEVVGESVPAVMTHVCGLFSARPRFPRARLARRPNQGWNHRERGGPAKARAGEGDCC